MTNASKFVNLALAEFNSARKTVVRKNAIANRLQLRAEVEDNVVKFVFEDDWVQKYVIEVPIPFKDENGVELINDNETLRPVGTYFIKEKFHEVGFLGLMLFLLTENLRQIFGHDYPSGMSFMARILYAYAANNPAWIINLCQRTINDFVHKLPLYETSMLGWAMNKRVMFLDPEFNAIKNPNHNLLYQVKKNEDFWPLFGWSSIGLSESTLSTRNYLLKEDIKRTVPFGVRHHNPQRNLYQTLGMKGPESPAVTTETAEKLATQGIKRGGKMLLTAFLDIPMVFEDHILGDESLLTSMSWSERRYQCFTEPFVKAGQTLKKGELLTVNDHNEPVEFHVPCEEAFVEDVIPRMINVGGEERKGFIIKVKVGRTFKDGTKFTNLHGNKGIVSFKKLGFAVDPRTGEKHRIEVLVSAASVGRRKNFGQVLEAATTAIHGKYCKIVLPDNYETTESNVQEALKGAGLPEDGTWEVITPWGTFRAVCGWIYWGAIKDPEDQLWQGRDTKIKNGRGLRRAGNKFSNIEIRALITRYGPGNGVVKEILSHFQGGEDLREMLAITESCRGSFQEDKKTVDALNILPANVRSTMLKEKEELDKTIHSEGCYSDGVNIELPTPVYMIVPRNPLDGVRWETERWSATLEDKAFKIEKIYLPNFNLRRPWPHPTGKFGLSQVGGLINRVLIACHDYDCGLVDAKEIVSAVKNYFNAMARKLSTKRGDISQYGMAIRYPYSSKATAVLGEALPKNTVEIHQSMAKDLKVKTGDIVLCERFPCLGFMSVRPQKVRVTGDPSCRYVIRVSGNSLVSQNLDFDGDVIYLTSFHSPDARLCMLKDWESPNPVCEGIIEQMNSKKEPRFAEYGLGDFGITKFGDLNSEEHAYIVERAVGVKSHTGPVIALAYNLMRIVEAEIGYQDTKLNAMVEKTLDFLGNTVFSQKHGIKPLQEEATEAICLADPGKMEALGFDRDPSELLCELIRKKAAQLRVDDLEEHYAQHKATGSSNIINLIVRRFNKVYFASRASLDPIYMLQCLDAKAVDLPSHMFKIALESETKPIQEEVEMKTILHGLRTKEQVNQVWEAMRKAYEKKHPEKTKVEPSAVREALAWPTVKLRKIEIPFVR